MYILRVCDFRAGFLRFDLPGWFDLFPGWFDLFPGWSLPSHVEMLLKFFPKTISLCMPEWLVYASVVIEKGKVPFLVILIFIKKKFQFG